jgi:DNA-binding response OmpR family regulator
MSTFNAHVSAEHASPDAPLKGLRILLVEDSWNVGEALTSLLRAMGAEVAGPAATTAEAERLLSTYAPDVAVVDFTLRGGELAVGLIDQLHDRGIRVVMTSGYDIQSFASEKVAILKKPFTDTELLASLHQ